MKNNIIIREVLIQDAHKLIKLQEKLSAQSKFMMREPDEVSRDISVQKSRIEDMSSCEDGLFVVAERGSEIVGFLILNVCGLRRVKHLGEFILGIDKDHWGRGIGSNLMQMMIDHSNSVGLKRLALEVVEDNVRGIGLYEKFGFVREGIKVADHYIGNNQYLNTVIMGKILDNSIL